MSEKQKLIKFICDKTEFELFFADSEKEESLILDEWLEELSVAHSCRYGIKSAKVVKNFAMLSTLLPCMDELRFRRSMRMSRHNFQQLLGIIEQHPIFQSSTKNQIPVPAQLAVCLYRLGIFGNGASVQSIARTFGISDGGTILDISNRVIKALLSLKSSLIHWPNRTERSAISDFMTNEKLPYCVGFIDGTHILLHQKPEEDAEDYINRKNQNSIQLQLTVDHNKLIRHMYVGFPGSVHDARVYSYSDLSKNSERYFDNHEYLIGDAAYPLSERMVTPFRKQNGRLTTDNKKFNKHISKHRVRVEVANGILKKRFASLNGLRVNVNKSKGHQSACDWITVCCLLYNYLLELNDPWTEDDWDQDELDANRERPPDNLELIEIHDGIELVGVEKRNQLKTHILN